MKTIKQLFRLLYINTILAKNGLDQTIVSLGFFPTLRFIVYLNPWTWVRKEKLNRAEAFRKTLETLGPIFIKFGQALSTRPDILPPDIAIELNQLQDKVPPFSSEKALAIIENAFGCSAYELFAEFDPIPLASASIAQVHAAKLKSGEEVVVKIVRPNIHKVIKQDLSLMKSLANLADRYWLESKRLKPKEIVQEFEHTLFDELDLQKEAANAGQLRRNFLDSPLLYVPEVYWDYTKADILVMQRIHGIPVTDVRSLNDYSVDLKKLAERGVEIFFTQVFRDRFFHADMHPGNIFVSRKNPKNPQYICVDFGIMGSLNDRDKRYLAENLYAFLNRDYRRVAQLHVESGWVSKDTRIDDFESAVRTVCEPIFEKPLKDISFAQLVLRLLQVGRRFNMEVQPQLILLQKTLFAVEGLGRQLYPDLDLWTTAKPFLEKWLKEQAGPRSFIRQIKENLPFLAQQLPHIPRLINEVLTLTKEEKLLSINKLNSKANGIDKKSTWFKGLTAGIFSSSALIGVLNYMQVINRHHLTIFTLALAALGGFMYLIYKNK
jgi:ubiquinone biosynthesis protein